MTSAFFYELECSGMRIQQGFQEIATFLSSCQFAIAKYLVLTEFVDFAFLRMTKQG